LKFKYVLVAICIMEILIVVSLLSLHPKNEESKKVEVYVGIAFCGSTADEAKLLINRVKNYTNLFVLLSGPVGFNETVMTEICEYAFDAGLHIIVFFGDLDSRVLAAKNLEWRLSWIEMAKKRWGDKFLGVYYYDEPGGIFIDYKWETMLSKFNITIDKLSYDLVAETYIQLFHRDDGFDFLKSNSLNVFVSDYALYWFDYLAGYDVVLAQVGWNHTFAQDIALVRGAATMQNKSWGIMITWKYRHPPYLDSAENIYNQMLDAYKCGADYMIIFNYAEDMKSPYGIMTDEHFEALERFWNDVLKNQNAIHGSVVAEAALALPKNYGWGMRHSNDKIWGLWGPDEKSPQIWALLSGLLKEYCLRLDVVYDDPEFPIANRYPKVYYWNQTDSDT